MRRTAVLRISARLVILRTPEKAAVVVTGLPLAVGGY
jgi:hypothetical protein